MNSEQTLMNGSMQQVFEKYEKKYKAVADRKRLEIMYELTQYDSVCVCELVKKLGLSQSKLSYHLKILLDAEIINKNTKGTWSYYSLNDDEVNHLLSEQLYCLFRTSPISKLSKSTTNNCCRLSET